MIGLINRRMHWKITRVKIPLISALSASLIAIIFAEFIGMPEIMMFGTTLLVLSAISGAILAISKTIRW
ncbi:MAG TPA: hypothetical protein VE199_03420, partial [Nitrososphaera sp.]|nr:hypothetical protein [Nitrososphaera sp.]